MSCLRRIAGVTGRDMIRNKEVCDRVSLLQDVANRNKSSKSMFYSYMRYAYHWLMPISCHFRDCKALLVTSLTYVSSAITSVQTFTFTLCCCPWRLIKNVSRWRLIVDWSRTKTPAMWSMWWRREKMEAISWVDRTHDSGTASSI